MEAAKSAILQHANTPILQHALPPFSLLLLVLALYAPALGHGLVWDDAYHFASNPHLSGLRGLWEIWTSSAGLYYPLTLTTFWLVKQVAGLTPWVFHAVTIAFHAGTVLLLWHWLRLLGVRGAWLAAALFAVHPVNVESVAWITELKNTQSGFFFLLTLIALERHRRAAALLAFVAALLSKSATVMLPLVVLLVAWWRATSAGATPASALRLAVRGDEGRPEGGPYNGGLRALLPFFVLALLAAGWTIWEQAGHSGATGAEWAHGWKLRGALAGHATWFYFFKFIWPHPLCFIYPMWTPDITRVAAYFPVASAAGLVTCLWFLPRPWARHALAGVGYFLILLFPALGFFNIYFSRYAWVADHFAYLALPGLCALVGAAVYGLAPRPRRVVAGVLVAASLGLASMRVPAFRDEATLWADTLVKNPGAWMVLNNVGASRQGQGDLTGARWFYEQAIRYNPDHYEALVNLGSVLLEQDDAGGALPIYERAVALKPDYPLALVNLGLAQARLGRLDEALGQFRRALALDSRYLEAHVKAAGVLERAGRFDEALGEWREALKLKGIDGPGAVDFYRKRADEFERLQVPAAAEIFRRAARAGGA